MTDFLSYIQKNSWASQTTTDAYVVLGTPLDKSALKETWLIINNTGGSNTATVKILGSIDGGTTYPLLAIPQFTIGPNASIMVYITQYYTNVGIYIQATSAGNETTITASAVGYR